MNRFRSSLLLALTALAMLIGSPALAQTTINSTTLSQAVTTTSQQVITLTSVSTVAAGDIIVADNEAMEAQAACDTSALTCRVTRGRFGTRAYTHASGVVVWTGPKIRFAKDYVVGVCTATSERYLPHIVLPDGDTPDGIFIADCLDSEWVQLSRRGARDNNLGRSDGATTYTASGAIAIKPGVVFLGCAGACAMTLANPTTQQNGVIMYIIATTAQAHTVTNTTGFDGGTTARDVATYGGAIGDYMAIIAVNGVWYRLGIGVGAFGNVTLG